MSTCTSIKKNSNCWIDKRMLTSFYLQDKFICMLALKKTNTVCMPEKGHMDCIPRICLAME
jgi:hypothetical protein